MRFTKLLFFFITAGAISTILLVYFYTVQRDFSKEHKELLINLNKIENKFIDTTNIILKNSIYIYINQDKIAKANDALDKSYVALQNSTILKRSQYTKIIKFWRFILYVKIYS